MFSSALQLRIELHADGLPDPSLKLGSQSSVASSSDRLASILERRKAWREFEWTKFESAVLPGPGGAYEYIDGVFAKTDGGIPSTIAVLYLPSRTGEGKQVIHPPGKVRALIADFVFDPLQDLLIFAEGWRPPHISRPHSVITSTEGLLSISIRTLSTCERHPSASKSVLYRTGCATEIQASSFVKLSIVNDTFRIIIADQSSHTHLLIWNWESGDLLVVSFFTYLLHVLLSFPSSIFRIMCSVVTASGKALAHSPYVLWSRV